ncbi:M50 family metallopeptidase [Staphylococcus felis]|uniref:M50 family metallopeptidase n=1 Tax=Staphylococcus felis TaxID=46127 RepID=A0ABS0QQ80_9STAP|nr:M50 family metallopeptidase [Staphylococcus felis]MBH9580833.1 M50 family metallopeptidase [Staphylococcus felis]
MHYWIASPLPISLYLLCLITFIYLVCHYYQHKFPFSVLDIALNYIPVLTHEFGHVFFNRISGGRVVDLVIVATRRERNATGQQGYAVTQSKSRLSQIFTTIGGYIMPPLMLVIGIMLQHKGQGAVFIIIYIFIFIYYTLVTSRKLIPISIIAFLCFISYLGIHSENLSNYSFMYMLVYHFLLGTLLGEIIQSSMTIFKLTFSSPKPNWDGTALSHLTRFPTFLFSSFWIFINGLSLYYAIHQYFII